MAACFVFDLTFSSEKNSEKDLLTSFFKTYTKQWVYQLERGDTTGYKHYQCRISLKEKVRDTGLYKLIANHGLIIHRDAISTTSKNSSSGEAFWNYCTKDHTRIEGPWTSRDAPLTTQMNIFDEWGLRP